MRALENKVVVVTGAGKGIGKALACGFAAAGAKVLCGARTEAQLLEVLSEITAAGGEAAHAVCDVADLQSVESMFKVAQQKFGGIDIVVGNAGIMSEGKSIEEGNPDVWKSVIDTNVMGAYYTARTAIPYLKRRGGGKIIMVGSGAGRRALPESSAYSCSKAALWMLVKVLAQELAPFNICVNELIPGPVNTELLRAGSTTVGLAQLSKSEWFKAPEDLLPIALFMAAHPDAGPTGQSFSLARREL